MRLAQPGFLVALGLCALGVALQMMLAAPLGVLDLFYEQALHKPAPRLAGDPLVLALINYVAFGVPTFLALYLNRLSFKAAFPAGKVRASHLIGVVLTVLGAGLILSELDNIFRLVFPMPEWVRRAVEDLFFPQGRLASQLFLLVITAPLTEELLFRGVIMRGLLKRYGPVAAIGLSAVLFGLVHLNPWQFLSASFLGCFLGWFYLRTRVVWVAVFGHAVANGLFLLVSLAPIEVPGLTGQPDFTRVEFQPLWLDVAGFVVTLAGMWMIARTTTAWSESQEETNLPPIIPPAPPAIPPPLT